MLFFQVHFPFPPTKPTTTNSLGTGLAPKILIIHYNLDHLKLPMDHPNPLISTVQLPCEQSDIPKMPRKSKLGKKYLVSHWGGESRA
ncbi:hypothetical protein TIFTF001_005995 [Ficus carica]|uniref:Uncharacterized protein n=1 Tax=Ficus carica TaxID=3494 RepID=A0AA88A9G2_FICCA|nr:hypothetical protein TIFTF001_005995 [Ficus carica]